MAKKFSTLLLTGKAATLPLLMQQAQAYTPSYLDILNTAVSQIELPVANQVQLDALGYPLGSDVYNGAVTLCSNTSVTNQLSLVITGLKDQDSVFVIAATDLGGNESLDPRIRIGSTKLAIPVNASVKAATGATVAMSVPLDLDQLRNQGYPLSAGGHFYLQTVVLPPDAFGLLGSIAWDKARVSEVDKISVGTCSTYGPHGGF